MVLYCFTLYPWYFCFNSQRSGPYFVVFSSFFFSRFLTHGQLISSVMTRFDTWLIMRASTLLALTSWCSANRGTSQNAWEFDWYTSFGFSGEYQGGTESTRHIIIIINSRVNVFFPFPLNYSIISSTPPLKKCSEVSNGHEGPTLSHSFSLKKLNKYKTIHAWKMYDVKITL